MKHLNPPDNCSCIYIFICLVYSRIVPAFGRGSYQRCTGTAIVFYCSSLFFPVNVGWSFSVGWFSVFVFFYYYFLFLLGIYNPFIVSLQSFLIDQYIYFNDGSSYSCACVFFPALFIGVMNRFRGVYLSYTSVIAWGSSCLKLAQFIYT